MTRLKSILNFILEIFPPKIAVIWFWVTISMTFYCGVFHVLPFIYKEDDDWCLVTAKILSFFFIGQIVVNWFCIRLISSRYRPTYQQQYNKHLYLSDIDGFEIDFDQMKPKPSTLKNTENCTLSLTGIRPVGNSKKMQWNHDTMILVPLSDGEFCFIKSNEVLKNNSDEVNRLINRSDDVNVITSGFNNFDLEKLNKEECLNLLINENLLSKILANQFSTHYSQKNVNDVDRTSHPRNIQDSVILDMTNYDLEYKNNNFLAGHPYDAHNILNGNRQLYNSEAIQMMPCNATPNKNRNKVVVYHYWSWRPCRYCGIVRPPRSHHCKLCRCCVLKRDHHCFFATNCIGLNNQRHFVVFLFWTCCAITFCLIHSILYLITRCVFNENCVDINSCGGNGSANKVEKKSETESDLENNGIFGCLSDVVLPVTVVKMIRGECSLMDLGLVVVLYSLVWFSFVCGTFFIEQLKLILSNLTSFEKEIGIGIIPSENKTSEINLSKFHYAINRAIKYINHWNKSFYWVFGKHWMLNFFLPLHFIYPCPEDGMSWKSVDFCVGSSRA